MKKNSAYVLLVPGFVLLLLFLMLPLCATLWPTVFSHEFSLNQYVNFFKDDYYLEIFYRTLKISLITLFIKVERIINRNFYFSIINELGCAKFCMD